MQSFSQRLTNLLIAWRWPLLAAAVVAALITGIPAKQWQLDRWIGKDAAAVFPAGRLDFDRSIENMFAPDDPLLPPYRRLKETFGGNEIVLAVYVDPNLLNPDGSGIQRLGKISERAKKVAGVREVLSLDRPIGDLIVSQDSELARRTRKLFERYTHGTDGETVAVVCMLEPEQVASVPRAKTVDELRRIMQRLPDGLQPGMVAGEPVMVVDGFAYIEEDGRRLGWASTILLALTIIICFRSLRWVLIPIAVVQFTLLLTKAALVWSGLRLSMVSSMLTAIVTVVGIATVVHIIVRFREARAAGISPRDALAKAGALVAAPVFWACLTDAAGFGSLLVAEVGPVRDFGIMMAVGSLLVMVAVMMLLPGLALLGRIDADPQRAWGEGRLGEELHRLVMWTERHPALLGIAAIVLTTLVTAGVFRLEVETDFTKNFRAHSPIVRSYEFIETNLGGAGVLDVILPAPESLDWEYLRRVQDLEKRLRDEVIVTDEQGQPTPGLTKVLSLSDAVIASSVADLNKVKLPVIRSGIVYTSLNGMRLKMPAFSAALYGEHPQQPGNHSFRIMLRARERQPADQKLELIEQVKEIVKEELKKPEWKQNIKQIPESSDEADSAAQVTGFFVLLTNLIESMIRDQWLTFGVATLGIGLMMLLAFRSPVLALVALVPNALPILMVLGLMGWLSLKINMGAAMIAAVSMGLSVDSSIHYITSFRRARAAGKGVHEALADVQQTVGRAMVFSTLALIVGFSVLCASQFVPTIYFGMLVSLSMLGGLLGNLLILPLLLKFVTRD